MIRGANRADNSHRPNKCGQNLEPFPGYPFFPRFGFFFLSDTDSVGRCPM